MYCVWTNTRSFGFIDQALNENIPHLEEGIWGQLNNTDSKETSQLYLRSASQAAKHWTLSWMRLPLYDWLSKSIPKSPAHLYTKR